MHKQRKIFVLTIILQLLAISYLLYITYAKYNSRTVFVAPLDRKTIHISPTDTLRYFFELKPNIVITDPYYREVFLTTAPKYRINNDTLNERFNYSIEKPKKTYRIITLGDSFTFGKYVNTSDNWPEQLEKKLKSCKKGSGFEVINLGIPGYDIQYSLERFKKRGIKYHPDLIIWFLKDDDFEQINEITLPIKRAYFEEMRKNGVLEKSMKNGEYWPHTNKTIHEFEEKYSIEQILAKQLEIMRSINKYYAGDILIVSPKTTFRNNKSIIEEFAKKRKKTYIYLDLPDFSILPDHHPNTQGHREIAKNIFTSLINKNLLACNQQ